MRSISQIANQAAQFAGKNSPAILTGLGCVGVLSTAFLTGKATLKASELIREQEHDFGKGVSFDLSQKDKVKLVWKLYIPPVGAAVLTIAAVVFSNRIDARRAAAAAAAYTISERAWAEYRDKIVETLGKQKEQKARDQIAQEKVTNNPPPSTLIIHESTNVLCLDLYTMRYLESSMEKLKRAQVNVMYKILRNDYASLSDFYHEIGLEPTAFSDDVGWNHDTGLELEFSHALDDKDRPCITFKFKTTPFRY